MNERRMTIMHMLNSNKKIKARELAERFDVSLRTIQRDLQYLQEIGFPLYSEAGIHGGYKALPNRLLPPLQLTEYEAFGLFLMLDFLETIPDFPYGTIRKYLAEQYLTGLPEETRESIEKLKQYVSFHAVYDGVPAPFTTEVLQAASEKRQLLIEYKGLRNISSSLVYPIGIFYEKGFWYMPAFKNENIRLYRIDRILKITQQDTVNSDLPNLKEWRQMQDERENMDVSVRFTPSGLQLAKTERILPGLCGEIWTGPIPLEELPFTAKRLYSLGADVKVLYPEELQRMIIKEAKACLAQYR